MNDLVMCNRCFNLLGPTEVRWISRILDTTRTVCAHCGCSLTTEEWQKSHIVAPGTRPTWRELENVLSRTILEMCKRQEGLKEVCLVKLAEDDVGFVYHKDDT